MLIVEFGWDVAFQASGLLRGPDADDAFATCWLHVLTDPIASELRHVPELPTES